jgi:hypothetical protein
VCIVHSGTAADPDAKQPICVDAYAREGGSKYAMREDEDEEEEGREDKVDAIKEEDRTSSE